MTTFGVEARDGKYQIRRAQLWKDEAVHGWVQNMSEKGWVDLADFTEALRIARIVHTPERNKKYWNKKAAEPTEEQPCCLDPAHIHALDEISGDEQLVMIFCDTHRAWEWQWVDRRWAGLER